jgi:hypothetical protein
MQLLSKRSFVFSISKLMPYLFQSQTTMTSFKTNPLDSDVGFDEPSRDDALAIKTLSQCGHSALTRTR